MFCSKCGTQCNDKDIYCQKCGNRLMQLDNAQNLGALPSNNENVYYTIKQQKPINFGLIGLISAIAILPVSLIIRFAFAKTVVKYGWRQYTTNILPDGMKVVGIIFILALLAISIVCIVNSKKQIQVRNKFIVPSIVIDIVTTIVSLLVILG